LSYSYKKLVSRSMALLIVDALEIIQINVGEGYRATVTGNALGLNRQQLSKSTPIQQSREGITTGEVYLPPIQGLQFAEDVYERTRDDYVDEGVPVRSCTSEVREIEIKIQQQYCPEGSHN
jgi:hypothetical protein